MPDAYRFVDCWYAIGFTAQDIPRKRLSAPWSYTAYAVASGKMRSMFRCVFAVVLFFAMLASGLYACAGEPAMAEHHMAQDQIPLLTDSSSKDSPGNELLLADQQSDTAEADSSFDSPALCHSAPSGFNFGRKSAAVIPFTPNAFLQPFSDGLRRPPRSGLHRA